jgi:hypothetical protein
MGRIYQNDVGKELRVQVGTDVSVATLKAYKIKKPGGTEVTWTATEYGTDTTHKTLTYTTVAGDLDEVGEYLLQAYCEWGATSKHLGETARFVVYPKYE